MKGIIGIGIIFLIVSAIRACEPSKPTEEQTPQSIKNKKSVDQQSIDAINDLSSYIEYFRHLDSSRQKQELVKTRRASFRNPLLQEALLRSMENEILNQERTPEEDQEIKRTLDQIDESRSLESKKEADEQ